MKKVLTLCLIQKGTKVLLGMKKRGFGEGSWNGFGGKVEAGESIENATIREVVEEACVTPSKLTKHGVLDFHFKDTEEVLEVHIFHTKTFTGTPKETSEMRAQWFEIEDIPYTSMWPDDIYWLPELLQGKYFKGAFYFDENKNIEKHSLSFVEKELLV